MLFIYFAGLARRYGRAFSSLGEWGLLSSCGAQASSSRWASRVEEHGSQ